MNRGTGSYRLGRYELLQRLGRGGMAEVWKARDTQLQRYVAMKVLHPDLQADPDFTMRFEREAQLIAALHHPNIVQIYDFHLAAMDHKARTEEPTAYMIMDYVEGQTLAQYLHKTVQQGQIFDARELLQIFTPICYAIDYAHKKGMVHRDLNPANILLDERNREHNLAGEPIISDFGISKMLNDQTQTQHGFWLGTPAYIAPEQVRGEQTTTQSDIYALAVILYETCTGTLPFRADGPVALAMQHVHRTPTPPNVVSPQISQALADVIMQGLAKDPHRRFATVSALLKALTNALGMPGTTMGRISINTATIDEVNIPTYRMPQEHILTPIQPPMGRSKPLTYASMPFSLTAPLAPRATVPIAQGAPMVPHATQNKQNRMPLFLGLMCLLIATLAGSTFVITSRLPAAAQENTGTIYFVNSGQYNRDGSAGITDEAQIDVTRLLPPDTGKAYYAWLLSDAKQQTEQSILLGRLMVQDERAHLFYNGDARHSNILAHASRFVLTMESASAVPARPGPTSTWRGYGDVSNISVPSDTIDHYSLLDHVRHLTSEDPIMASIGLHGGLNLWSVRNSEKLLESASNARDEQNTPLVHRQVVRCLEYLDGKTYSAEDMPAGTPMYIDPLAGQVGLLTFSQEQPVLGLLLHIRKHLVGLTQAPQATGKQTKRANQLSQETLSVEKELMQARNDARQIVVMNDTQLGLPEAHTLLNDLYQQVNQAYVGQADAGTGDLHGGVEQISEQILQLATIDVKPYTQAYV